jgi:riboflavin synthase
MFTGIIEAVGKIESVAPVGGDLRLRVEVGALDMGDVALGDSIATNGVCLTVVDWDSSSFTADVSQETLAYSRLADLAVGEAVNLEKALLPTTRLGGHLVSGHVDGVGEIYSLEQDARSIRIGVAAPKSLHRFIAAKGSITVDGVSLTVNALSAQGFELNIVPHTAEGTIIQMYQIGQQVHLEVDMIARYLERLLSAGADEYQSESGVEHPGSGVSMELLASAGFLRR